MRQEKARKARKRHAVGVPFLYIKFAERIYKKPGRVPGFLYLQREKVSERELSDVRVLRSQNTACRKNEVFRQLKRKTRHQAAHLHRPVAFLGNK